MTRDDKLLKDLREIVRKETDDEFGMDYECVHANMSKRIMEELKRLGYTRSAEYFEDTPRWYA